MKLYHGSNVAVEQPQILRSDRKLDFGVGFYLTSSYEQAERWAHLTLKRRGKRQATVTVYNLQEQCFSSLKVLKFEGATEEWLKFVSGHRNTDNFIDNSDIVIGPVANDRTMPVLRLYLAGLYDETETIKRLLPQKLTDQYTFKTKTALKALTLSEVIRL
jgi:hypothetical protein